MGRAEKAVFPPSLFIPTHERRRRVRGNKQPWWATPLSSYRWILMSEYIDVRYRRLLERLFRRSRPNCLKTRRLRRRPSLTSNGRLLRYMQVRLAALQTGEVHHMLTKRICCSFALFLVLLGGADNVRLSHLASRVLDH